MQFGVEILLEASIKLECTIAVRIRALVLYHHFTRCSSQKSVLGHNDAMVAAAALKCASRYEEENIDYDTLVLLFYCIVNKTDKVYEPDEPEFMAIKKSLITVDHIMQRKLEYIFSHRLAHQFMVPFLSFILERNYKLSPFHQSLSEATMRFANDLYTDPLCINYKPDHLAIACIHAALHVHGLLKDVSFIEPWFQAFSRDLTVSKLREIKIFLFRLYNSEKQATEDVGLECEVVPPDGGEKENIEVQETPNEEIVLVQEVDGGKQVEHSTKHINKGKKKQGKRKLDGKSNKRRKGVGKRRRKGSSSKCDGSGKNHLKEDENKNEERNENQISKSENPEGDKNKSDGDQSKNNENETDRCKNNQEVGEKCKEEDKRRREESDERVSQIGNDVPNRKIENNVGEGSQKRVDDRGDRTVDKESVETIEAVEKEHSSGKDVSTLDLELSAWAARFKAARELNCSVTDV